MLALLLFAQADPMAAGMKALEAKNYDQAAAAFRQAVQADEKDYVAHFHLALSLSLLNRDAEAIPEYRKTLELKPGLYQAQLNLGILLVGAGKGAGAVSLLDAAVAQKPAEFRPNYYQAEALMLTGDAARAVPAYEKAIAANPTSAPAQLGLGQALIKLNRLADAAPHFGRAAELDPAYRNSLLELASAYEKAGEMAQAVAIYRQFPDNPGARERAGELLLEGGKTADAIPALEAAVVESPTAANRAALAAAYIRNKQLPLAIEQLKAAVAAESANMDLRMAYGRALRDARQYAPAAQQFFTVTKARPNSGEAWNELAAMLILTEAYPQALVALDKAQALTGESPGLYYFRAIVLDHTRQYEPAMEAYQKFLAMSEGKNPDEEFKARQRIRVIKKELSKR
ncbi:MAG: tetratricopeptide repeat protein [Bryobacterales bacterium]|nr:tetratricopeptide repeat protein [Bryobacterales bacterium]